MTPYKKQALLIYCIIMPLFLLAQKKSLDKQTISEIRSLHIGDTVPELEFDNMYNFSRKKAKLSDFKGKLVILDFWNFGCVPCIKGFPKLEKLQNEFKNKMQVILANVNDTKEFLKRLGFPDKVKSTIIRDTKLPFAMLLGGTPIEYLFPAGTLPYHVWINENGVIIAMTTGVSTIASEVSNYFEGKQLNVRYQPTLPDVGLEWDDKRRDYKSILQPRSKLVFDNLLYSSVITKNLSVKGFSGNLYDSATGKIIGIRISGETIYLLKRTFSNDMSHELPDRVVLEVDDPENYIRPSIYDGDKLAEWEASNIYSYELKLPPHVVSSFSDVQTKMRQDLEAFFGVKATVETRKVNCRILINSAKIKTIPENGGSQDIEKPVQEEYGFSVKNYAFSNLVFKLSSAFMHESIIPLVDETNFPKNHRVNIEILSPLNNVLAVKRELNKYGLDIIEGERFIKVLVIKSVKKL